MTQVQYPYLDLTVLPDIRPHVISASAAVLFDKDISQVLWANGEGANYIGSPAIRFALEGNLRVNPAMLRQIRTATDRLETRGEASAIMRVRRGFKTRLINFTISHATLPGGEQAYLLLTEKLHNRHYTQADMIDAAVNCLDGNSHASAVLDADGAVIASSEHFATLEVSSNDLVQMAQEANAEKDRLVKRPVGTNTGPMPSGIARLQDAPVLHLLVIANLEENKTTADAQISELEHEAAENTPKSSETDGTSNVKFGAFSNKRMPLNSGATGRWYYKTIQSDDNFEDDFEAEANSESVEDVESNITDNAIENAVEKVGLLPAVEYNSSTEETVASKTETETETETEISQVIPTEKVELEIAENTRPVRFIWEMDDNETFTSLSRELADSVGEKSAALEGRSWSEVARSFGFENGEDISALLKKGDTWSGKTVLWPVEGTDLRVPIDLAGLPSYGRNRNFDGFNGFGIIRKADAVVDPQATGMSLDDAIDGSKSMVPGTDETLEEAANEKVVDLAQHRNGAQDRALSSGEQEAFREIAETLGQAAPMEPSVEATIDDNDTASSLDQNSVEEAATNKPVLTPNHDVDTSILARLSIPVLVYRENELLFANEEFSDLTGYKELNDLALRGGVDVLFGVGAKISSNQIYHADGQTLDVHAHIQRVPWDDKKAILLTLRAGETPKNSDDFAEDLDHATDLSTPFPLEPEETSSNMRLVKSDNPPISPSFSKDTGSRTNEAFGGLSGEDLRSILDTATDGVIILSDDGIVRAINKSAEAVFDQDPKDVQGQSFIKLLAPESQRAALDYLRSMSDAGVASLLNDGREVIGRTAKGGLLPLFMTIGKLDSTDACCAVVRDITAWKKAEEDLLTARAEAEKANEQKTEFLARISHEIRTPLNAIIGFSDMMIEERFGRIENDRYRGYLRDIQKSGSHVLDLVNDLLDISKIEAGKMQLSFDACNLNAMVSEAVAMTQPEANKERVIIRTSLSAVVPKVVADPRSLKQIVLNLVSNSIKYTKSGGQVIVSTVYEDNGEVVLRVRDTGVGMSDTELAKAMRPFEQLSTTMDARKQGTGLGLPLTKAMVEANRAQFHIESKPEEGTMVEVHFPSQRVLADR